ncbi:hypothetical protein TVAG_360820 [Trichomonas vaginalis G3]|uniref:HEAT repeat family protein n=1 Tax=Trichomonas vaginalis (strain ATCC PRA-98 / G3) TaxID=412133 RepID=A2FGP0_TRIV3|nr:armadillo (ARM) repeat-containing protein family [Trichomonas vaginalis G3]EAX95922.1 hypothetical protein TVAG_360820 [Trichomonas vaginalis G3]KAI5540147.1 armadillo (ARM) repeat-containing protein family [Trichomonas vaginalis G3]|eukprot:XP_001308852.1 hypothetical protein [Trichomonas vaginalis G3]
MEIAKLALSPNLSDKIMFVNQLGELTSKFDEEFINKQLLPFLINWYNSNQIEIGRVLSTKLSYLVFDAVSKAALTTLICVLALSDDRIIRTNIINFFSTHKNKQLLLSLCGRLSKSNYDSVRCLVPKLITSLTSTENQKKLVEVLSEDKSYCVKETLVKMIPKFSETLQLFTIQKMLKCKEPKLRQILALVTKDTKHFNTEVFPALIKDSDWYVQASILKAAGETKDPAGLIKDIIEQYTGNWEIKVSVIKSLTAILKAFPDTKFEEEKDIYELFKVAFPEMIESYLGQVVINLLLELIKRKFFAADSNEFRNIILSIFNSNYQNNWGYFLNQTISRTDFNFVEFVMEIHIQLAVKCLQSHDWRQRAKLMETFEGMYKKIETENTHQYIINLALSACQDTTQPVRVAASNFLVKIAENNFEELSKMFSLLIDSDNFRNRQVGFMIALGLLQNSKNEEIINFAKVSVEKLKNDPQETVRNIQLLYDDMNGH